MNDSLNYQKDMTAKKTKEIIENGYSESDFDDSYWTAMIGTTPRVDRDPSNIVNYFEDHFLKINVKQASFLDICAGAGNVVNGFRKRGINAHGCEFSASGRRVAKKRFGIELDDFDLRKPFPYKDNQFDFGCCVAAFSMTPRKDMLAALSEIFRVVKRRVLFHVASCVGGVENGVLVNPHHLTGVSHKEYDDMMSRLNIMDITALHPPQDAKYGIGVGGEFCKFLTK